LTLDDFDLCVLILLLRENPSRSLKSYCSKLFEITGTTVSTSTVSRVWTDTFEIGIPPEAKSSSKRQIQVRKCSARERIHFDRHTNRPSSIEIL
jgi:hypothetical protein